MSTYSADILATTGLLSYWRLGEPSGVNAADSKGALTGTYTGSPTLAQTGALPGDTDTAVAFNGTSQYVAVGSVPTAATNNFSLECWVKLANLTSQLGLFAYNGDSTAGGNGWGVGIGDGAGGTGLKLVGLFGAVSWLDSGYTFSDTNWHHVVIVRDAGTTKFYLDGAVTANTFATVPNAPTTGFRIAAALDSSPTTDRWYHGSADEVAIYNAALSAATVLDHYTVGSAIPAPPTVVTQAASNVAATSATLNATVNPNGKSTTAQFEWGLTTGYGTIISLGTVGSDSSVHALSSALSSLTTGTTYHYRISATNSDGTSVGSDQSFTANAPAVSFIPPILAGLWTFDACDGSGNVLTPLTRNAGTRLTFTRNGVPECELSLSHDDDECAAILTALVNGTGGGMPTLKGYRVGADGTKVLRFNGYLAAVSEESGTEASSATFTFRGPFGRLLGNGSNTGAFLLDNTGGTSAPYVYAAVDAGSIAVQLMNAAPNVKITAGSIPVTKTRDRTYPVGTNIGQAIVDLTNVLDGFDFDVAPVDQSVSAGAMGIFNVYAKQGADRTAAKFEYGEKTLSNCTSVHRQTVPPSNVVVVYGASNLYATTNPFNITTDSISRYGTFQMFESQTDVAEAQTLSDKANALLRSSPVKTLDFTPDPKLGPAPFDDYYIGDTVYFYGNRNAFVEGPQAVRVNAFTVVIEPDTGLEAAEIPDPTTPDEELTIRASLQTEVVAS